MQMRMMQIANVILVIYSQKRLQITLSLEYLHFINTPSANQPKSNQ